ncbi:hypothetical protein KDW_10550 [Dictyobacter vulcani]|uniref:Pyrrolo-quinoline quinone repeat domain-containing protein n=1 Tax=Dictyobacter vulcani TaxID=2607529 RepID=A0A5J4KGQ4_9CHLR|nr:PQQ-binding-like beta-propeller repeat protein [Dictyobacter vulcani]GER86893.1 hypothetical protein KDW_10550 [Dictyobacter vulcani]
MHDEHDFLSPEHVDEYIEQFPKSLNTDDAYLINDLQQYYQESAQQHTTSLNHVWERMRVQQAYKDHATENALASTASTTSQQPVEMQKRIITMQQKSGAQNKTNKQKIGLITTTAAVVVLVASMLIAFTALQPGKQKGHTSTASNNTTTKAATPFVPHIGAPDPGIYITTVGNGNDMPLKKIDLKTHKVVWTYKLGNSSLTTPVAQEGAIYIAHDQTPGNDKFVTAIDSKTGKPRWEADLGSDIEIQHIPITDEMRAAHEEMGSPFPAKQKYIDNMVDHSWLATPTVVNGVVYMENEGGRITALDASTGKQLWVQKVGDIAYVDGTRYNANPLVVVNNVVYGSIHKTLFALDANTGKRVWLKTIDDQQIFAAPVVDNGMIYLTSAHAGSHTTTNASATAYAYNSQNGQLVWSKDLGKQYTVGSITLANHMLYVGTLAMTGGTDMGAANFTSHMFFALSETNGEIKWQNTVGSPFVTPLFENNILYLQEAATFNNGVKQTPDILHAYNPTTGVQLWQKNIDGISPAELHDGIIYGTGPGHDVSALSAKDGSVLWQGEYAAKAIDKMGEDGGRVFSLTVVPQK